MSELCAASGALRQLRSITLTVETAPRAGGTRTSWPIDVANLLAGAPLERFHISSLGGDLSVGGLDEQFCADIVTAHGERLRRFSVHRLRMTLESVRDVCARCPNLEQLFVVLDRGSVVGRPLYNVIEVWLTILTSLYLRRVLLQPRTCAPSMSTARWGHSPIQRTYQSYREKKPSTS